MKNHFEEGIVQSNTIQKKKKKKEKKKHKGFLL